jgi:hypothetical protein
MFFVALQMIFTSAEPKLRAVLPTAAATGAVAVLAWLDRRFRVGQRARRRLVRWIHRHRPPRQLDEDVEYHI